jgi:hypothetical protein
VTKHLLLLVAALITAPTNAAHAQPVVAATPSQSVKQAAGVLARVVAPREIMIPLNMKWAEKAMEELPKLNAEAGEFEREYPGVHNAMWFAAKDEIRDQLDADMPNLWDKLERLYLSELSEREIRSLISFFATPTGKRLIAGMYGNSDLQPVIQSMATSDNGTISEQSLRTVTEDAKRKAVADANIDPKDVLPIMKDMPLAKLRAVGEKAPRVTYEWVNEEDPQQQERIDKLMADAAEGFIKSSQTRSK